MNSKGKEKFVVLKQSQSNEEILRPNFGSPGADFPKVAELSKIIRLNFVLRKQDNPGAC
jgi:hypothetical protein